MDFAVVIIQAMQIQAKCNLKEQNKNDLINITYHKIPKISPSMYKPLWIEALLIWKAKISPIISPSEYKPLGACIWKLSLIIQRKLHIIPIIRKPFLVIKEWFRALKQCGQQVLKFIVFYPVCSSLVLWIPSVCRTKYLQGSSISPPWTKTPSSTPGAIRAFIVIMNFVPELHYRYYCISVLIKFIAIVFELGIFSVIKLLRISNQNLNITSCTFKNFDTNSLQL